MLDADTIPGLVPVIPQPRRVEHCAGAWPLAQLPVKQRALPELPPEAYRLEVADGRALVEASDPRGFRHARATLAELADAHGGEVPGIRLEDAPVLRHRGIIEGFSLDVKPGENEQNFSLKTK